MKSADLLGLMEWSQQDNTERSTAVAVDQWSSQTQGAGQYAEVNGINLYFETQGTGRPLVLLHGGLGSGEMFGPILPALAADRQVIAVDLQGHGRTADIDRPLDIRLMADDIAALIQHLGIDRGDVMGYSLGGGVATMVAVRHPDVVRRLVSVSAHIRRDAVDPAMLAQQGQIGPDAVEFMKDTPMYALYQRVAPRPEDFGRLLGKIGEAMAKDFDFSDEIRGLKVPTLVAAADADMAPPSHYVEIFALPDGGRPDGGWQGEGRPRGGDPPAHPPGPAPHHHFSPPPPR